MKSKRVLLIFALCYSVLLIATTTSCGNSSKPKVDSLKTGYYDYHDIITGGTLITLTEDLQEFTVEQIINEEHLEPVIQ